MIKAKIELNEVDIAEVKDYLDLLDSFIQYDNDYSHFEYLDFLSFKNKILTKINNGR